MRWGIALLAAAAIVAVLVRLRRSYVMVTVSGTSMEPGLRDGDHVLVRRVPLAEIRAGEVVLVRNPRRGRERPLRPGEEVSFEEIVGWYIKRAVAVPGDPVPDGSVAGVDGSPPVPEASVVLLGDNAGESFDSRQHGFFAEPNIVGVVKWPRLTI